MMIWSFCFLLLLQLGAGEEKCTKSAKLDVQIIVDSSLSVGKENFHKMMKNIASSVAGEFDIGPDKTRVALFKYSQRRVMRNEFGLNAYSTKSDVQKKIENTKFEPGYTLTAMAMNLALKSFKKLQRKDKETARVCLVFTDGEASDKSKVPRATKAWAKDGVKVFAIGIGAKVKHDGLKVIAGADERAFEIADFDAIADIASGLLKQVCKDVGTPVPETPKVPTGYARGNDGYYYKFYNNEKTWNEAQDICETEGGNIAIIFNEQTRDVVRGFMSDGWIGASDQWQEGKWQTPNKQIIPYSSWGGGEPNNMGEEDCAMQHSNKLWNDLSCGSRQKFTCQFITGSLAIEPTEVPIGYARGNDNLYYKFHKERKNWNEAQRICQREGGNLAVIFNQQTRDIVRGYMSDGWIGASDQWQEGKWQTSTKGNIPYSSWGGGEPNNMGEEDCAMQHSNKLWNDLSCGSEQQFICQFIKGFDVPESPKVASTVGYKYGGNGYYYKYYKDKKNWNEAQNICKRDGGNLAIIFNQLTRDIVSAFMSDGWIGASDQWQEGKWQTPTKGNIPYSSWGGGEPNNMGEEDCVIQHSNKLWNDLSCGSQQPFICQKKV